MKSLTTFLLALTLVVLVYQPAGAQQARVLGNLSKVRPGVLSVMDRADCPASWLSQVIIDSPGITANNLRRLPEGQSVIARGNTCRGIASASVRARSIALLQNDSATSTLRTLRAEVASLTTALARAEKERDAAQATVRTAESAAATLNTNLQQALARAVGGYPLTNVWQAAGAGGAIGIALTFFYFLMRARKLVALPEETMSITDKEGVTHLCKRTGIVESPTGSGFLKGNYACPLGCSAPRIYGDSMLEHVNDHCPARRIVMVEGPGDVLAKARLA